MELKETENQNYSKQKKTKTDEGAGYRDQFRVVITKEANEYLDEVVKRVNEDFSAGEITKSDIANYIFSNMSKVITDSDVRTLRALHFDERKSLNVILKGNDDLPEELRKAIRAHFGISDKDKRKPARSSIDET